jgi:hypothetical protein
LFKGYANWDKIYKAIEYAYAKYIIIFTLGLRKEKKLNEEERTWKIVTQERISKMFPDWSNNEYIIDDEEIQNTPIIKEGTSFDGTLKPQNIKINTLKKSMIHTKRGFKKAFGINKKNK